MSILCTGEVLWDVFGERELLGGAPLNFSVTTMRLGHSVALLSGVGDDARGRRALEHIRAHSLSTEWIQTIPGARTGTAIVTTDSSGNATYRIDRPAAFDSLVVDEALLGRLQARSPAWLYFGTLAQSAPGSASLIETIRGRFPGIQCFYDANLREGHWNLALVQQLSAFAAIMQVNEAEASILHRALDPKKPFHLEEFCRKWTDAYNIGTLCVTLGGSGCAILAGGNFQQFEGFQVDVADTVGSGDAFAGAFLHGLISDWPMSKAASFANAVGAMVASQAGAIPDWTIENLDSFVSSFTKRPT